MKKLYILLSDTIIALISGFCFFIVINSISKYVPCRFAETIYEGNSFIEILCVIIFTLVVLCFFVFKDFNSQGDFKITHKFLQIFLLVVILFVMQIVLTIFFKIIYKEPWEKFENLVKVISAECAGYEIKIYENDYGFEFILVTDSMFLKAGDIEKIVPDKRIAIQLEFETYNSDLLTIKATKGRMVFRKELNTPKVNLGKGYFIARVGEKIKIYKTTKNNRTIIENIE
ncbi:MAG: hypothetical protein N3E50_02995 [Candidatus Goldbacteria bacterium]|nr:hypothetical protein [Candidatus Goldiibacteriota bacterium]